jgi:hypothetical protein
MATLQTTTVPDNGYYRVGVGASTSEAYISSGGSLANFGKGSWYNGSIWQGGGGPTIQLTTDTLKFYNNPVSSTTDITFSNSEATTTLASTTTTVVVAGGSNTTTNSTLGIGAAAGPGATDGKIRVNAGDAAGNVKPILEVTNCLGDGSTSTSTYSVFKGYLAIKIGTVVGPATSVPAGTHYIRLWSNA